MKFVCFSDWSSLPKSADLLFDAGAKESIFFSRQWFENLVDTGLKEDETLLFACVIDDSKVLALLPLMKRPDQTVYSLANNFTSLYTLLLAGPDQQDVIACLAEGFKQLPVTYLQLAPVADNDPNINCLQQSLEAAGYISHRYFRFHNWVHRLQGESFHAYMSARPARLRNTIARKRRKLEREQGYEIRLFIDDDLERGLSDYGVVYKASWKGGEYFGNFVEGLARRLSRQGWLRLAVLYIAGKPVAAQIWFVVHAKASIFRLVYDEAWKVYSPGSILTSYLMEYVIDTDKVVEIDFLTGNERYKQDWLSECRGRWKLEFVKPDDRMHEGNRLFNSMKRVLGRLWV